MATATATDVRAWQGMTVIDQSGSRIGKIEDVYFDEQTDQPEWALVNTGMFGRKHNFVPIVQAERVSDDMVRVHFSEDQIKGAPSIDAEGELSQDEERRLYDHYGLDWQQSESETTYPTMGGQAGQQQAQQQQRGHEGRDAMTRSEEEVRVGTVRRPHELVRLRKYIVTENVTQTVPVTHEEVRVEREPITEANVGKAMQGPEMTESEHEVTLMHEEPVVEKRVVPKERVSLEKDVVTGQEQVTEEVRKEQVEVERGRASGGTTGEHAEDPERRQR